MNQQVEDNNYKYLWPIREVVNIFNVDKGSSEAGQKNEVITKNYFSSGIKIVSSLKRQIRKNQLARERINSVKKTDRVRTSIRKYNGKTSKWKTGTSRVWLDRCK